MYMNVQSYRNFFSAQARTVAFVSLFVLFLNLTLTPLTLYAEVVEISIPSNALDKAKTCGDAGGVWLNDVTRGEDGGVTADRSKCVQKIALADATDRYECETIAGGNFIVHSAAWDETSLDPSPAGATSCVAKSVNQITGQTMTACEGWGAFSNTTKCIWEPLASWLSAIMLRFGGWILVLAGNLFDKLVEYVIINFKGTLDLLGVTSVIDKGWTLFRDVANIFIIGIFTFISISIILGIQAFGQKKFIARVLIVAVLINFSLLFTKMIIDASNFVAYSIHSQLSQSGGVFKLNEGISASFLKPMGVNTTGDTEALVKAIAEKKDYGGGRVLAFGFVGMLVLIATAIVLLYGAFLIMARALLFIFLMLTAALAFATFLLPQLAQNEYGWNNWWKALINGAVFAPLLMIFLAISTAILKAAEPKSRAGASIGDVLADPLKIEGNEWLTIIVYILGVGLLFLSMKLANSFAGQASGFNIAKALTATPFTLGSRFIAAPLVRGTYGKWQYNRQNALEKGSAKATEKARRADLGALGATVAGKYDSARRFSDIAAAQKREAAELARRSIKAGQRADVSGNIMQTKSARKLTSGLPEWARGAPKKDEKGFKSEADALAKKIEKIAVKAQPGAEDSKKQREEMINIERARAARQEEMLKKTQASQNTESNTSRNQAQNIHDIIREHAQSADAETQKTIEQQLGASNERHASELRHETERIKSATGTAASTMSVQQAREVFDRLKQHKDEQAHLPEDQRTRPSDALLKEAVTAYHTLNKHAEEQTAASKVTAEKLDKAVERKQNARHTVDDLQKKTFNDVVNIVTKKESTIAQKVFGVDDAAAGIARKKLNEGTSKKRLRELASALKPEKDDSDKKD
jgi:hypothetical protein